jgi:hypothetical protein
MPQTFDEVIADVFTVKNDTIPSTAWPKLTCGVANEVTFQDSSLKLEISAKSTFKMPASCGQTPTSDS